MHHGARHQKIIFELKPRPLLTRVRISTLFEQVVGQKTILDKFSLLGNKLSFLIATVDKVKVQRNIQFIC